MATLKEIECLNDQYFELRQKRSEISQNIDLDSREIEIKLSKYFDEFAELYNYLRDMTEGLKTPINYIECKYHKISLRFSFEYNFEIEIIDWLAQRKLKATYYPSHSKDTTYTVAESNIDNDCRKYFLNQLFSLFINLEQTKFELLTEISNDVGDNLKTTHFLYKKEQQKNQFLLSTLEQLKGEKSC